VIDDTRLYYACEEGILVAREIMTGKEVWNFKYQDSTASEPAVSEDLIVFQTGTGTIFCLNKSDGTLNWISKQPGRYNLSMLGASQPLIIGDRVYLGLLDGFVAEFKLGDGSLVWKQKAFKRPIVADVDYKLVAYRDTISASSPEGVCAISKNTGKVFWCVKKDLAGDSAQEQDFIYSMTKDRNLLVIDKITGIVEKKLKLKKPILEKWEPERLLWISKDDKRLILVLSGSVWEWNPEKKEPERIIKFPDKTMKRAEIQGDRLYLINSQGYLISRELE